MRELKFRAWHKRNKKYIVPERLALYEDGSLDFYVYESDGYSLECFVLEQYTGLKDKNGKEIYEGDIVKMPDWGIKPKCEVVKFSNSSCGFDPFVRGCFECIAPDGEEVEIVGNIHENKDLIRGEE